LKVRRIGHSLGVALAVVSVALVLLGFGEGTQRAQVPRVLGESAADAIERIERHDLRARVLRRSRGAHRLSDRYKVDGHVVFQEYRGGITLPRGTTVRLMVFEGERAPARR
jgi:beta-lactam-binding protein with PASTA domain